MKRYLLVILSILALQSSLLITPTRAEDWKIYASYHNPTKAVKADSRIFVLANGDLFSYDTEDETVETYDKTNHLSDFGISDIAYCQQTKTLIVIYDNANIDLLGMNGETWNMPEFKNKSLDDKTIKEVTVIGDEALISTGSGLAVLNLSRKYFVNFYALGGVVYNSTIADGYIYTKVGSNIYKGDRSKNLLDVNNWVKTSLPAGVAFGQSTEQKAEAAELLEKVSQINIDSPLRNYFYRLNLTGDKLLAAGGNFYYQKDRDASVLYYQDGKWGAFEEEGPIASVQANTYWNATDVVEDPSDPTHHFVGTARSGIYEFKDYKYVEHYSIHNSPLATILPTSSHYYYYVRVTALAYDHDENLWMCNNQTDTIVRIRTKKGDWLSYYYPEVSYYATFDHTIFDQRGWAWIQQRRTTSNGFIAGVLIIDTNGTIMTQSDDRHRFISSFVNQDGTSYTPNLYYCVKEDMNGHIWIGTSEGLFVTYNPENVFDNDYYLSQVKVPRNDGTNYADYLMNGVSVKCIAFDGGNRKWIGTLDNGVYLISADGLETIAHFTTKNSPLISDAITDIAVDGKTGEVFIATDLGLCSYMGDAIDPSATMKSDNLKVWPNPVRPEYAGNVHVGGLMMDSSVKIVNAAGKLVYEGVSVGGEFSWNCCYKTGKRVAPGIYYALCTDQDGNEGACAKILIVK